MESSSPVARPATELDGSSASSAFFHTYLLRKFHTVTQVVTEPTLVMACMHVSALSHLCDLDYHNELDGDAGKERYWHGKCDIRDSMSLDNLPK